MRRERAVAIRIKPTRGDLAIARVIEKYTNRPVERVAELITWGADEHLLCAFAAAWWLACRRQPPAQRRASNHVLLTTLGVTALPHLFKTVFDQKRPDRLTIEGHAKGVPFSGRADDAFPSGHAMHVGALASAATRLPPSQRNAVWAAGAALVTTRIVLLAHWTSDILTGLVIGAAVERLLRPVTGFGRRGDSSLRGSSWENC